MADPPLSLPLRPPGRLRHKKGARSDVNLDVPLFKGEPNLMRVLMHDLYITSSSSMPYRDVNL